MILAVRTSAGNTPCAWGDMAILLHHRPSTGRLNLVTNHDQPDPARVLRERIIQTMSKHNRCDIHVSELLKVWENQVDDDVDLVDDFTRWCNRRGWKAGRGVTVPRYIVTR